MVALKYGVTDSGKATVWEGRDSEEELYIWRFLLLLSQQQLVLYKTHYFISSKIYVTKWAEGT
jgi:hypothetical protein